MRKDNGDVAQRVRYVVKQGGGGKTEEEGEREREIKVST